MPVTPQQPVKRRVRHFIAHDPALAQVPFFHKSKALHSQAQVFTRGHGQAIAIDQGAGLIDRTPRRRAVVAGTQRAQQQPFCAQSELLESARNLSLIGRTLLAAPLRWPPYFAAAGKIGNLPTSRGSCWMMSVAFRFC